jgi:hypothetical protein
MQLSLPLSLYLSLPHHLSLTGKQGSHTLFTGQKKGKREGEREREREGGRENKREGDREKKRDGESRRGKEGEKKEGGRER